MPKIKPLGPTAEAVGSVRDGRKAWKYIRICTESVYIHIHFLFHALFLFLFSAVGTDYLLFKIHSSLLEIPT